ncbi:MAG TPA: oligosaccharide flippase family protein, partial [Clostridiales bacterium]|nr:oligosaccharide flippase family protein [Clostridiales bacterium]
MKRQSLLNGALVLVIATALVKVIGALFKIPITNLIGPVGRGYFGSAYNIFIPVYNIAMAGLPVAISKLVAQNIALGRYRDV